MEEAFLPGNASVIESKDTPGVFLCAETQNVVEWSEEDNYLFRLTHFKEELRRWLTSQQVPLGGQWSHLPLPW